MKKKLKPITDPRLKYIRNFIQKIIAGDFKLQERPYRKGDVLDTIIDSLHALARNVSTQWPSQAESEERVNECINVISSIARLDYTKRARVTDKDNLFDALATGVNMLTEELLDSTVSKQYVDNIIRSVVDMLVVVAPDTTIKTVNRATCMLLEYQENDLVGKEIDILFADNKSKGPFQTFRQSRSQDERNKDTFQNYDMVCNTKSGKTIPVSFSGSVMRDRAGKIEAIVGIARDMREINSHMEKERRLAQEAAKAADAERKRSVELDNAYKQLQKTQALLMQAEKLKSIGGLAAGVAHEVKNPLAIILQGVGYLSTNMPRENENVMLILNSMEGAIRRADHVVKALLEFSRAEDMDIRYEDMNSVIENALGLVKHELIKSHIMIVKDLGKDMPKIKIDKGRITQVLINIFTNAIQAIQGKGKIKIHSYVKILGKADLEAGHKLNDVFRMKDKVMFVEVDDDGPGVSADIQETLFEPFVTSKRADKGTGLGLSITRSIVDMHKGIIYISNRKEGGARVTLILKV